MSHLDGLLNELVIYYTYGVSNPNIKSVYSGFSPYMIQLLYGMSREVHHNFINLAFKSSPFRKTKKKL